MGLVMVGIVETRGVIMLGGSVGCGGKCGVRGGGR